MDIMEIERILLGKLSPEARTMALEGVEALTLYLKEIECNMQALNEQVALLQKALTDRKELLHETHSEGPGSAEPTGGDPKGGDAADR